MREDWEKQKIIDVCLVTDYVANGSFKSLSDNVNYKKEKDFALLLRTTDFTNDFKKSFVYVDEKAYQFLRKSTVYPDDIVICNVGSVGLTFLVPDMGIPMTIGPNSILIRPLDSDVIDNNFFYYLFTSPKGQSLIKSITSGTTQSKFNKTNFRQLEIPIPPLSEQKQIVAILDKAFAAIEQAKANIEKNIQNAMELFQSKLNEIFSQKGDGWETKMLNEICEVKDGTHDSPKYVDKEIGIPFVTQKNILENGLSFENTKFISPEDHNNFYRRSNVAENDILFSMIGANRGMVCLVDDNRVFSIKNVGLIKSNHNYKGKYLLYYLKSPIAKDYVANNSSGSAQGFIGLGKLRTFPIPYTNVENQMKIEIVLESLNESVKSSLSGYLLKKDSLEELKKSILQKAFTGELTVKDIAI